MLERSFSGISVRPIAIEGQPSEWLLGEMVASLDLHTGKHSENVSKYAVLMVNYARNISGYEGLDPKKAYVDGKYHDIGKVVTQDRIYIVNKPDRLNAHEIEEMQNHPADGGDIVEEVGLDSTVAIQHHERWNGSGYPKGLKGEEITPEGRLFAVVDVFEALTAERPYKKPLSIEQAVDIMLPEFGIKYDPALLVPFIQMVMDLIETRDIRLPLDIGGEELEFGATLRTRRPVLHFVR